MTTDRRTAADRAIRLHYLTATQDDDDLCASNSEPYLATRGAAYVAVLDYLLDEEVWWRQPTPTLPQIAWEVVTVILPDSGPEPIDHMVKYARQYVLDRIIRANPCYCEHESHFDFVGTPGHAYARAIAGSKRVLTGRVCDECAEGHCAEYLTN